MLRAEGQAIFGLLHGEDGDLTKTDEHKESRADTSANPLRLDLYLFY
jgi:hypothetical protein